jgi:hypothetical protein
MLLQVTPGADNIGTDKSRIAIVPPTVILKGEIVWI